MPVDGGKEMELKNINYYKVILSQLRIAKFFGHNFLVLIDETGAVISELNGLATSKNGKTKPIGYLLSDRLKVYEFRKAYFYKNTQQQITLLHANKEVILRKWNVALKTVNLINIKKLPYPLFGLGKNSNSVASTLIRCMGLYEPKIPGGAIAPFSGEMVLSESEIKKLQDELMAEEHR